MNIEELLNKYFEGETSAEEEKFLRNSARTDNAPESLRSCLPIFEWAERERKEIEERRKREQPPHTGITPPRLRLRTLSVAAAAVLALAITTILVYRNLHADPCLCASGYVVIDGRCYADPDKARAMAMEVLREVATPVPDLFPENEFFTE